MPALTAAAGSAQLCNSCGQTRAWQFWDSVMAVFICAVCYAGVTGQTPKQSIIGVTSYGPTGNPNGYGPYGAAAGGAQVGCEVLYATALVRPAL
jgi:hypothetical protein